MTWQRIIQRRANTRPHARHRRTFAVSGDELVLAFVKAKKNPTTKQINQHWKSRGRAYTADNTLTKLVKEKKLKRTLSDITSNAVLPHIR